MSYKKLLIGLAVVAMVLGMTVTVSAQTTDVAALMAQIAALQSQISGLTGGTPALTASTNFSRDLTVGSTGSDVRDLQLWLNSNAGASLPGSTYFGALTKAALMKYQASVGLPATGFFGPLTRAHLAQLTPAPVVGNLPAGCVAGALFSATTGASCSTTTTLPAGCVAGALFSSTTGASCTGTTNPNTPFMSDGTDGSVTVSKSTYVATTQTLKKGDMDKPIFSLKFTATVGNVAINHLDIHFDTRPFLVFTKLTLKDTNGNVIATKALNGIGDVTEVTADSDYMVRFDGLSTVVKPGTPLELVVTADVPASSDKVTGSVATWIPSSAIRTLNGKGYTDSLGLGESSTSGENTITLSSTGSTGDLQVRIDPSTPAANIMNISTSNDTVDQVLGVFDVKLVNETGSISTLVFKINNDKANATQVFRNVRLYDGSTQLAGADFVAATPNAGTATFTLNGSLPINTVDTWKALTLKADVIATTTTVTASSTLDVSSSTGHDSNYNTLTCSGGTTCTSVTTDVTSNNLTFQPNVGISVSGPSVGTAQPVVQNNYTVGYTVDYTFTITNTGSNTIYVPSVVGALVATSSSDSTQGANASTTMVAMTVTPDTVAGDNTSGTPGSYAIVNGQPRTFTLTGRINPGWVNGVAPSQSSNLKITKIYYGTANDTSAHLAAYNVNFGLSNLTKTVSF